MERGRALCFQNDDGNLRKGLYTCSEVNFIQKVVKKVS